MKLGFRGSAPESGRYDFRGQRKAPAQVEGMKEPQACHLPSHQIELAGEGTARSFPKNTTSLSCFGNMVSMWVLKALSQLPGRCTAGNA